MGVDRPDGSRSGPPDVSLPQPNPASEEDVLSTTARTSSISQNAPSMTPQGFGLPQAGPMPGLTSSYSSNPLNMVSMGQSLPRGVPRSGGYPPPPHHRYNLANAQAMMPPMQPLQHFGGSSTMPVSIQGYYGAQSPPRMGHVPSAQHQSHMAGRQNAPVFPGQMMMPPQHSPQFYYPQQGQFPSHPPQVANPMIQGHYMPPNSYSNNPQIAMSSIDTRAGSMQGLGPRTQHDPDSCPGTVRGPPRKPRQSGHAIWVGNLPPQTDLMNLVHHVCKEAPGLESLFLISKSNCAFANFKDESSCVAAQQRLHDSKFQNVRLVSRLRKGAVESVQENAAPSGSSISAETGSLSGTGEAAGDAGLINSVKAGGADGALTPNRVSTNPGTSVAQDKFFILKSLTVEDLDLSVGTGIWATQPHNETALNEAFKAVDNVYLVFSANKSGEYYGYARMTSEINEDPAAAVEFAPKSQSTTDVDHPVAIPTEATEHVPKGRIIDDSARGTIFWESEHNEIGFDEESEEGSDKSGAEDEDTKTWGKPFKLEWLSTTRLPFFKTRGLRNPWNSNREIKIARDGTELEPSVGRKLIGLFNRIQTPPSQHDFGPRLPPPIGTHPGYMGPYRQ